MRDTSWDTPYIHGRDKEGNEYARSDGFESSMTVILNNDKLQFSPHDFLHAAWTNGFDTPCNICKSDFDLTTEPPVRLLRLDEHLDITDPLRQKLPPISVENYHLRCLKTSSIDYLPVSHPWHSSVAEAYALRTFNAKAAQACYESPIRTLMAIHRRFGPDCLLWHDYISIPQWHDESRGTVILPQIFKVFEISGRSILHLGQQPPSDVVRTPTFEVINQHSSDLKQFFTAHLFSRLWPIVEFDRAGEAYIMSNEYEILKPKFTAFVREVLDAADDGNETKQLAKTSSLQWLNQLPIFIQERQKNKCFGYVFDMIAELGCRSFRDKFIGASELLGVFDYPTELPSDSQDACLWLAERRIQNNDLSPLLLSPSEEPAHPKAEWLKGHQSIVPGMWGWGVQRQPSKNVPRVQSHAVHLDLQFGGTVTQNLTWNLQEDGSSNSAHSGLLDLICSTHGSAGEMIHGLESIDPLSLFQADHIGGENRSPSLQFCISTSKHLLKTLRYLIDRDAVARGAEGYRGVLELYNDIVALLALSVSTSEPKLEHFERLSLFRLRQQICDLSERNLVSVTCPGCQTQSTFRAQLWQQPTAKTHFYLIPGLTYQHTAASGTGIFMEGDQIIGRTRFCNLACDCKNEVSVTLI